MSHTSYRLTAISIGAFIVNAIAANPTTAKEVVTLVKADPALQQSAIPSGQRSDLGFQPIIIQNVPLASFDQSIAIGQNRLSIKDTINKPAVKQPLGLGINARIGTLGAGLGLTKSITPQLNARLGVNFGKLDLSRTDAGIDYGAQLNLSSVELLGEFYPFGNGLRLTGGLVSHSNRFSITSKLNNNIPNIVIPGGTLVTPLGTVTAPTQTINLNTTTFNINGQTYTGNQVGGLTGEYKYPNSIAPYLGIGFGKTTNEGFGFNADLGVMFTGSPKVTLNASNPTFYDIPGARENIDKQLRQTENDLKSFSVYPVLSVGISYAF